MPDLGTALDGALTARYGWETLRSPATSWRGLQARMNALEKARGGRRGAAQAAGIGYSTWTHLIARRREPSAATLRRLEAAYARDVLTPRVRRAIARKQVPTNLTVTADIKWSNSPRKQYNRQPYRKTHLDQLTQSDMAAVVDVWLRFGGPAAGAALERVTTRRYGLDYPKDSIEFQGDQVVIHLH